MEFSREMLKDQLYCVKDVGEKVKDVNLTPNWFWAASHDVTIFLDY
jgi:hypothetical protein